MKFLQAMAGVVFILSLAVFLVATFVRQGLLNEATWLGALEKSEVTQQFEDLTAGVIEKQSGAEAAALARKNMRLDELRQMVEDNVTSTVQYVRGGREELVLKFGQGGKYIEYDATSEAAKSPDAARILSGVRLGYQVLTWVWVGSGILSLLTLLGFLAAGEPKRRLRPLAKLIIAGSIIILLGVGVVGGLGGILAKKSVVPINVAGEIVLFNAGGVISAVVSSLMWPIAIMGISLAIFGSILLVVARKHEPRVAASLTRKSGGGLRKKVLLGAAVVVALSVGLGAVGMFRGGRSSGNGAAFTAVSKATADGWGVYHSKTGYRINLPDGWKVEEKAPVGMVRETIWSHPDKAAFVLLRTVFDTSMKQPGAVGEALKERMDGFAKQPGITVTDSSSRMIGENAAYVVEGTEKIAGKVWNFREQGQIGRSGKVLILHGSADLSLGAGYRATLVKIIESFDYED